MAGTGCGAKRRAPAWARAQRTHAGIKQRGHRIRAAGACRVEERTATASASCEKEPSASRVRHNAQRWEAVGRTSKRHAILDGGGGEVWVSSRLEEQRHANRRSHLRSQVQRRVALGVRVAQDAAHLVARAARAGVGKERRQQTCVASSRRMVERRAASAVHVVDKVLEQRDRAGAARDVEHALRLARLWVRVRLGDAQNRAQGRLCTKESCQPLP